MLRSLERGLSLRDFDVMTVGMILDFLITSKNENLDDEENEVEATQSDFDRY